MSDSTQKNAFTDDSPISSDDENEDDDEDSNEVVTEGSKHIILGDKEAQERIQKAREARKEFFESEHNTTVDSYSSKKDDFDNEDMSEEEDLSMDDQLKNQEKAKEITKSKGLYSNKNQAEETVQPNVPKQERTSVDNSIIVETRIADEKLSTGPIYKEGESDANNKKRKQKSITKDPGMSKVTLDDKEDMSLDSKIRKAQDVGDRLSSMAKEAIEDVEDSLSSMKEESRELERETISRIREEVGKMETGSLPSEPAQRQSAKSRADSGGRSSANNSSSPADIQSNKQ